MLPADSKCSCPVMKCAPGKSEARHEKISRRAALRMDAQQTKSVLHEAVLASAIVSALANPKRCQILFYTSKLPNLSIGDLSVLLDCSDSLASLYVKQLNRHGWMKIKRCGQMKLVSIPEERRLFIEAIQKILRDTTFGNVGTISSSRIRPGSS